MGIPGAKLGGRPPFFPFSSLANVDAGRDEVVSLMDNGVDTRALPTVRFPPHAAVYTSRVCLRGCSAVCCGS